MKRRNFFKSILVATAIASVAPTYLFTKKPVEFEFDNHKFLFVEGDWVRLYNQLARTKTFVAYREDGQNFYAKIAIPDYEWRHKEELYPELKNEALTQLWELYNDGVV